VRLSALEKPKPVSELLDFRQKYLSGGASKAGSGSKIGGRASQGMLSLTREMSPDLPADLADKISRWSRLAFERLAGTGAPRIDYLCDGKTGDIWFNEINPCPGSFAYFLWEAADPPVMFTELLTALIEEALALHRAAPVQGDPVPADARLFDRRGS
ncbi:MAG TPA: hypothetical protein VMW31_05270, partial [Devosiaceae bacterium]|nr:hypothetical protein [Devosiaceae bacterium]